MTDLVRFVKRLVEVLESRDPSGVHRPITVAELRTSVFPYRTQRSPLGLTSAEDYDLLVLRLVGEEEEFVRTNPPEAGARARDEAAGINPNLDLLDELEDATIQIGAAALVRILAAVEAERGPALEFLDVTPPAPPPPVGQPPAPPPEPAEELPLVVEGNAVPTSPEPESAPEPLPEPVMEPIAETIEIELEAPVPVPAAPAAPEPSPAAPTCRACHAALPARRTVTFCPYCGERQGVPRCSRCGVEMEPGWRHCVECGQPVPDAERRK